MSSTIFSSQSNTPTTPEVLPEGKEAAVGGESEIEVPYLDYHNQSGHPYLADHYQLGDTWNDPVGGFPKEVDLIEMYIEEQIKDGEIANNPQDVKSLLKRLEKMTNVDKESRSLVKIETLAAYVKFLMETDKIKFNLKRYGNT